MSNKVRYSTRIPESKLNQLKEIALQEDTTVTGLIIQGVDKVISSYNRKLKPKPLVIALRGLIDEGQLDIDDLFDDKPDIEV